MITRFLSLLCFGFALGFVDGYKNEKLPKPSLDALPGPVVERRANVTLKCRCHFQNVTVMLGKLQDPGYKQEQSSAGYEAEFFLVHLEPKTAGTYFCAYQTMDSHAWSEKSEHLQLVVTDNRDGSRTSPTKTATRSPSAKYPKEPRLLKFVAGVYADTRIIFITTFSCLTIFLLFPSVFLIYRCSQRGSSPEEAAKRTGHSKFPTQEAADLSMLDRESLSTEDPQEDTSASVNNKTQSEEGPRGSCE